MPSPRSTPSPESKTSARPLDENVEPKALIESSEAASKDVSLAAIDEALADVVDDSLLQEQKLLDDRFTKKQLEKQKGHLTRSIADEFIAQILEKKALTSAQRKSVVKNVQYWFTQRCRSRAEVPRFYYVYSACQVFYKENTKLVIRRQRHLFAQTTGRPVGEADSDDEPDLDGVADTSPTPKTKTNGKPYGLFDFFQAAVSYEWDKLMDDEREEYEEKASEWRLHGPPEEVKRSRAEKDVGRYLYQFAEDMFKQMGVKLYFLVSFTNTKGLHTTLQQDFGKSLYGAKKNFREIGRPVINKSGAFGRWNEYTYPPPSSPDGSSAKELVAGDDGVLYPITFNDYSEGVVPNPDPSSYPESLPAFVYLQKVVRSLMTHAHALSMGAPIKDYTPTDLNCFKWQAIGSDLFQYAKRECFPDDVTSLADPSRMGKPRNLALLKHWWDRQQLGLIPLEFHSYYNDALKGPTPRVPRRPLVAGAVRSSQREHTRTQGVRRGIQVESSSEEEENTPKPKKRQAKAKAKGKGRQPPTKGPASKKGKARAIVDSDEGSEGNGESSTDENPSHAPRVQYKGARMQTPPSEPAQDSPPRTPPRRAMRHASRPTVSSPRESHSPDPDSPSLSPMRVEDFQRPLFSPDERSDNVAGVSPFPAGPSVPMTPTRGAQSPQASQGPVEPSQQLPGSRPQPQADVHSVGLQLDLSTLGPALQQIVSIASLLQPLGAGGDADVFSRLAAAAALQQQQTPSRVLAEGLGKVRLDSSPTKPYITPTSLSSMAVEEGTAEDSRAIMDWESSPTKPYTTLASRSLTEVGGARRVEEESKERSGERGVFGSKVKAVHFEPVSGDVERDADANEEGTIPTRANGADDAVAGAKAKRGEASSEVPARSSQTRAKGSSASKTKLEGRVSRDVGRDTGANKEGVIPTRANGADDAVAGAKAKRGEAPSEVAAPRSQTRAKGSSASKAKLEGRKESNSIREPPTGKRTVQGGAMSTSGGGGSRQTAGVGERSNAAKRTGTTDIVNSSPRKKAKSADDLAMEETQKWVGGGFPTKRVSKKTDKAKKET